MLDLAWPVEPSRMIRLSLINMRRKIKEDELTTNKLDTFLGKGIINQLTETNMILNEENNEEEH